MTARAAILARIGDIPRDVSPTAPRGYRREGALDAEQRRALFCERVGDYRADVSVVSALDVAKAIAAACAARGAMRVAAPSGLPSDWRPASVGLVDEDGLTAHDLDRLDGVVTGCTLAIAETGTIVLTAGSREGRRASTLVPDLHVCVVEADQIVELVPEAMARLAELVRTERRPVTMISGPSATSDIELSRVEGVHGPRTLVVLVVAHGIEGKVRATREDAPVR